MPKLSLQSLEELSSILHIPIIIPSHCTLLDWPVALGWPTCKLVNKNMLTPLTFEISLKRLPLKTREGGQGPFFFFFPPYRRILSQGLQLVRTRSNICSLRPYFDIFPLPIRGWEDGERKRKGECYP